MTLDLIRLLIDFGLLVLIWMVQLVIYPSFQFYKKENLISWHKIYTKRLAFVVIPLMLGQLIIAGFQLFDKASLYTVASIFVIIALWISTFIQFVPRHNRISQGNFKENTLVELVKLNWIRTVLWTILFLVSCLWNNILP